jgi:hypothetical protein
MGEGGEVQCLECYTCQVCVSCEKYGGAGGQAPPQQMAPMPLRQPAPQHLLTEEDIRRIVKEAMLEVLIQLGLVKPQERKRELK